MLTRCKNGIRNLEYSSLQKIGGLKISQFLRNFIAMSSLLVLTATSQNYSGKVLKILKTFLSRPRPRPRLFSQDQDQDQDSGSQDQHQDFISVLEAPRDQDLGLEDYITGNCTIFFATPYIISRTCKATVFKFSSYIHSIAQ